MLTYEVDVISVEQIWKRSHFRYERREYALAFLGPVEPHVLPIGFDSSNPAEPLHFSADVHHLLIEVIHRNKSCNHCGARVASRSGSVRAPPGWRTCRLMTPNARLQPPPRSDATKEPQASEALAVVGCKAWLGVNFCFVPSPGISRRATISRESIELQPDALHQLAVQCKVRAKSLIEIGRGATDGGEIQVSQTRSDIR